MKLLLDTYTLIWALGEPQRLSERARHSLENPNNPIFVSAVSFWEISLKAGIGKLELGSIRSEDFLEMVEAEGWQILPLNAVTAAGYGSLPKVDGHKDPFDRILIHLAIREGFHFVSKDAAVDAYLELGLQVCW